MARVAMQLRPRRTETLRCAFCLDGVQAAEARYLRERGAEGYATLAVHADCAAEASGRYVVAQLAYGLGEGALDALPILDYGALAEQGAEVARELVLGARGVGGGRARYVFPRGGQASGVVLRPTQIAARGSLEVTGPGGGFVEVYEPLAIASEGGRMRLCLEDSLGLKVVRGLVFSGGRMLSAGSYHSSARMSEGLVSIDTGGIVSVVYGRGDFVDVEGGITLSKPPSHLPAELQPRLSQLRLADPKGEG